VIIYNSDITIEDIPVKAYDYIVNGRSAIEWIMERYQVKVDKNSGIVNDPNLYAEEMGQPDYILKLLLSVIAVSVRTQEIVSKLPDMPNKDFIDNEISGDEYDVDDATFDTMLLANKSQIKPVISVPTQP
jgi:hypothetical protein